MNEKSLFLIYLAVVLFLGVIHSEMVMVCVILLTLFINKKAKFKILKKAFLVILFFNATVTLSYIAYSYFVAVADPYAMVLINLRAFAITSLTFTLVHNVNLHKALEFHPLFSVLYSFTFAQITLLKSLLQEYYFGITSRGATLKKQINTKQLPPLLITLFGTMIYKSQEQTMALKSRGLL